MISNEPAFETLKPILDKLNSGKLNEAYSMSSQLVLKFPKSAILFNLIGASYSGLLNHFDAIESYKKAIENYTFARNANSVIAKMTEQQNKTIN